MAELVILENIFPRKFYIKFKAPCCEDLIDFVQQNHKIKNYRFQWGPGCIVDKSPIDWDLVGTLLMPSIEKLKVALDNDFAYKPFDPWVNTYRMGSFQEIHDHRGHDFSCVFFANINSNFGSFYFYDRDSNSLPRSWDKIMNIPSSFYPDLKTGDIIFFPSDMLHGVTPHKSDEVRKTLACNFNFI